MFFLSFILSLIIIIITVILIITVTNWRHYELIIIYNHYYHYFFCHYSIDAHRKLLKMTRQRKFNYLFVGNFSPALKEEKCV